MSPCQWCRTMIFEGLLRSRNLSLYLRRRKRDDEPAFEARKSYPKISSSENHWHGDLWSYPNFLICHRIQCHVASLPSSDLFCADVGDHSGVVCAKRHGGHKTLDTMLVCGEL